MFSCQADVGPGSDRWMSLWAEKLTDRSARREQYMTQVSPPFGGFTAQPERKKFRVYLLNFYLHLFFCLEELELLRVTSPRVGEDMPVIEPKKTRIPSAWSIVDAVMLLLGVLPTKGVMFCGQTTRETLQNFWFRFDFPSTICYLCKS
jgi:hypothetical protein